MTNRIHAFVVVLEEDMRDDDAEPTLNAIRQLRGVIDVAPSVSNVESHMAEVRAKQEVTNKIYEALKDL